MFVSIHFGTFYMHGAFQKESIKRLCNFVFEHFEIWKIISMLRKDL